MARILGNYKRNVLFLPQKLGQERCKKMDEAISCFDKSLCKTSKEISNEVASWSNKQVGVIQQFCILILYYDKHFQKLTYIFFNEMNPISKCYSSIAKGSTKTGKRMKNADIVNI